VCLWNNDNKDNQVYNIGHNVQRWASEIFPRDNFFRNFREASQALFEMSRPMSGTSHCGLDDSDSASEVPDDVEDGVGRG
jgi:hypothetical protein